ncbi:synaptobrevin homolog YKT6 [Schistocerca americana]|uniref:synaptobrevin homolog YKT6 n=1 Tax=Schistocerca americana TaxID=7009 RepID=UPI001F4FCCD1|nr:synaptobrevin homolog YKT6 [Schistocerca americana]XP_047101076.1 synaptobrevin homolog YKT6 [Schistocerca piceifrons]XP_049770117.1 synaptobrevin homolog YKT6 [Schistocerca cancellata]XP_049796825.1 synaptobrevin homolog YKT6 [Schistocerca nitens]XP_049843852.1 synaptobrevin homolog YKT6 [Schistocerca gregaria]XP_049944980.1 synaptobrevin homolog YKT6 [Schistocerca serialis cubense]
MKLYALNILYKGPNGAVWLKTSYELASFSYFQRSSIQEFMAFASKTIVERTHTPARQSVREKEYMCHVYVRADNLAGVLISDQEYPHRVAHTLITKVLDEFATKIPASSWPTADEQAVAFPQINTYLARYQNPREADPMTKIQEELDETKIILHNTIEAVLQRGEKLDDLVAKSEGLSIQSKAFYKTARKTNSCCSFG